MKKRGYDLFETVPRPSSADSVIQRLHSRQLKILSSTKPLVPGTVRATRKAPPQLGQTGWATGWDSGCSRAERIVSWIIGTP